MVSGASEMSTSITIGGALPGRRAVAFCRDPWGTVVVDYSTLYGRVRLTSTMTREYR